MYLSLVMSIFLTVLLFPSQMPVEYTLPRFEPGDCLIKVPGWMDIECGYLETLEDSRNPQSRVIRSPVIIIHSKDAGSAKEAVLYTEGGPGFSSLQSVWWLAASDFVKDRDIVILEQRGNIYAQPSLMCDFSIWKDEGDEKGKCLERLRNQGIDLANYTTASIAEDINALKQVLDYESWNLIGSSYSTRLMQVVMDRYPENVRSVVLVGLSPLTDTRYQHDPEHTARALHIMFEDCKAEPQCAEAYPDLESEFYTLVRDFNEMPTDINFTGNEEINPFTYPVNGSTLISWMDGSAFYGPAYPPHETAYLPLLIHQLAKGNTDLLYAWVKNYVSRWGSDAFAWGLYFSVNCQDDAPSINADMVKEQTSHYPELDGYSRFRTELSICDAWALDGVEPLAVKPVESDIPVLFMAGSYDPITPPDWGRTAVVNMRNSSIVEFPSLGHAVIGNSACARHIITSFINNPTLEPDISCVEDEPVPDFVQPGEIIIAPAIYEVHFDEIGFSMVEHSIFLCSLFSLFATGAISITASLLQFVRKQKRDSADIYIRSTLPILISLAMTCLVWGFALRWVLREVARTTPVTLRFGLPASYWWVFGVVIVIGLQTLGVIVITVKSWYSRYWSIFGRIALSLSTLAAILLCALLAKWGLFTALFR